MRDTKQARNNKTTDAHSLIPEIKPEQSIELLKELHILTGYICIVIVVELEHRTPERATYSHT